MVLAVMSRMMMTAPISVIEGEEDSDFCLTLRGGPDKKSGTHDKSDKKQTGFHKLIPLSYRRMKRSPIQNDLIRFVIICICLSLCCLEMLAAGAVVKTGADVARESGFTFLKGKRVGLVAHPPSVTGDLNSTVEILSRTPGVKLTALYGPEHGVYGDELAGNKVADAVDKRTGVKIHSLYGKTRQPTSDMLKDIDVLVFDLQDIGCRSYTYISTLYLCMQAAVRDGKSFIVLDRPNPLGGLRVEGPMLDSNYTSFVGQIPVAYVHGMTLGEVARWINGEKLGGKCSLEVIEMKGWKRDMLWAETGLAWVPTSPHIPQSSTCAYYVATGILGELGQINNGVGYPQPFELAGAPWIDRDKLAAELNARQIPGVYFRPVTYRPFYTDFKGQICQGVHIMITDERAVPELTSLALHVFDAVKKLYPDRNVFSQAKGEQTDMFDKVNGSDRIRKELIRGTPVSTITASWKEELEFFRQKRNKYLIYK